MSNPYLPAKFRRQYSWRNGKNGVTVGSVAAIHLIDMTVADNNKVGIRARVRLGASALTSGPSPDRTPNTNRNSNFNPYQVGFEFVGADGIQPKSMTSETKLRGKWGDNLLIRPLIVGGMLCNPNPDPTPTPNPNSNSNPNLEAKQVGHMLSCPSCDPSIALGLTHVSMGTFVVPDNGVDCLNGCQVCVRLRVRVRVGIRVRATVRVKARARARVGARARTTARVPAKPRVGFG